MKEKREVLETLFLILQVGITMLVTIGICFAIGFLLDHYLETHLLWVFIILGILSGYRAVYLLIRRHIHGKPEDDKQEWYHRAFSEEELNEKTTDPSDADPAGPGSGKNSG